MIRNLVIAITVIFALAPASCATVQSEPGKLKASPLSGPILPQAGSAQKGVETGDLNRKVDPCTDFYEFANGAWRDANPIPPSMPRWGRRPAAREASRLQLRDILEELASKKDWPAGSVEQRLGDHYASCMDEARIDAAGLTPLAPWLADIDGIRNLADVERVIRRLHDVGVRVLFGAIGDMDYHEPVSFLANVVAGGLGLPDRDYYLKPEPRLVDAREKYRVHVANVLKLGGMREAPASKAADAIFALEKRLAEASLDSATAADPVATDHKMTLMQLEQLAPSFPWGKYFDEANLPRTDVNVAEPKLLQQLDKELKETPVATWKAYFTWQLLDSASPWLSKPFVEESFAFKDKYLKGVAEMKPRALRCVESTDAALGDSLGKKYAERHFPPAARAKVLEIIHSVLAVLKEDVAGVAWMGPETKRKAIEKLTAYNTQIGYPNVWKDEAAVTIRRDAFWANVVAGRKFNVDNGRKQIGKPTIRDLWQVTPSSADSYIDLQLNEIVLPVGSLQPPVFRIDATDAVNYGAIGAAAGHELTHAVDELGAQQDVMGRPLNWWTETDHQEFQKRGQCIIDQFEGYFIEPGVHHQGKLVQSEAIADLAGVRMSYRALKKSMVSRPVPVVDGFTPEQQFFIAWGQLRGDAIRLEAQRQIVKSDIHPVSKFRVIGPLVNLPEFQEAFSCKPGAEMVRAKEKRCAVW